MEQWFENIAADLTGLVVDIDSVKADPANCRKHTSIDIKRLAHSLIEFGQRKPIVVNSSTGFIEAGNGIWLAAKHNGWKKIAAIKINDDPLKATIFGIVDNRLQELSSWDDKSLGKAFSDLRSKEINLTGLGFSNREVEKVLESLTTKSTPDEAIFPMCPSFDEHYEIIIIICRTEQDWIMAQTILQLRRERNPRGKTEGTQLSRVVEFERFAKLWKSR